MGRCQSGGARTVGRVLPGGSGFVFTLTEDVMGEPLKFDLGF